MTKTVFLHMGLHKTGSTSIQKWLRSNPELLRRSDVAFYEGRYLPENHIEVGLSALREEVDAPIKKRVAVGGDHLFRQTRNDVNDFVARTEQSKVVISNETLSFIRTRGEIERLAALFPETCSVVPIVFLRAKAQWLASFRRQMASMGVEETDDVGSCGYFGADSWLLQHETLVDLARRTFGTCRVLEYEGASLAQFLPEIGVETEVDEPRFNVTDDTTLEAGVSGWRDSVRNFVALPRSVTGCTGG